jgi:ribosomal protein L37AE/L43A
MRRTPHHEFDGTHWDTRLLRRIREGGWFRQHESELIRDALRRRAELSAAEAEARRRAGRHPCPKCGSEATSLKSRGGVMVGECSSCGWLFVERGDLDRLVAELTGRRQPETGPARPDSAD